MDKIFIHDLRVEARIGVYDWEKHLPQTVRLDLELAAPSPLPFQSGKIADALDYAKVVERLQVGGGGSETGGRGRWRLVRAAAGEHGQRRDRPCQCPREPHRADSRDREYAAGR